MIECLRHEELSSTKFDAWLDVGFPKLDHQMSKRKAPQKQQNEPRIVEVDDLGIPLVRPSEQEEIDEDEQWRLINDTGILQNLTGQKEEEDLTPLAGSIRELLLFSFKKAILTL